MSSQHDYENWPEVLFINDYAMFMGYLSMAVTGTGFLVLTWSTVVLLGGFVSMLSEKDFWSLTVITLVQTRIFDIFLNGNISEIGYSFKRLWEAALSIALPRHHQTEVGCRGAIRMLVFTIVLCPLFLLYMFGLFISPWISLWRLMWQDYGETVGDSSKAHLRPALLILYSLALFQGVLFYYRAISAFEEQKLVKNVALDYRFDDDEVSYRSILGYLHEIKAGCEKDPSFAGGKNLITYAGQLMESTSPDRYLSGIRILHTLIQFNSGALESKFPGQSMLIYKTIGSESSGSILHNMVQMLDSKGPCSGEIRLRAAKIVQHFASDIRLEKVLRGSQCIRSLLEQDKPPESEYGHHIFVKEADLRKELHVIGIQILYALSLDQSNLRVMSNTDDLASMIVEHINNMELHTRNHNQWSDIAKPGMEVLGRFMSVTTRSINILRNEISTSTKAISLLQNILDCDQCGEVLKKQAILVLAEICMHESSAMSNNNRESFIKSLIFMYLQKKGPSLKKLAGEELCQLCVKSETRAIILKQYGLIIVKSVGETVSGSYSIMHRKIAADILKQLYHHYSADDENFQSLNKAMIDLMPKVLREALAWSWPVKEIQRAPTQTPIPYVPCCLQSTGSPVLYYESRYHGRNPPQSWYPQPGLGIKAIQDDDVTLQEALASLCATVYEKMVSQNAELTSLLNEMSAGVCNGAGKTHRTFAELIKEAEMVAAEAKKVATETMPPPPPPQFSYYTDEDVNACCIS